MDEQIQILQLLKKEIHGDILVNEPMKSHTTFKIGGPADFYIYPRDLEDLTNLVRFCEKESMRRFIIGNGSNLLVHDDGFRGVVVDLSKMVNEISYKNGLVSAGSGVALNMLLKFCMERGLSGLEELVGIPGQVGGGIKLNAGAWGNEISQHLFRVTYMDRFGTLEKRLKNEIRFDYRICGLPEDAIIIEAEFRLPEGNPKEIEHIQKQILSKRRSKQPLSLPSAGSVFKRPKNDYAGRLIEEAGCKGLRIGDAMVSKKHANFIVNCQYASAHHVMEIIEEVRRIVHQKYEVKLELEIHLLGFEEK